MAKLPIRQLTKEQKKKTQAFKAPITQKRAIDTEVSKIKTSGGSQVFEGGVTGEAIRNIYGTNQAIDSKAPVRNIAETAEGRKKFQDDLKAAEQIKTVDQKRVEEEQAAARKLGIDAGVVATQGELFKERIKSIDKQVKDAQELAKLKREEFTSQSQQRREQIEGTKAGYTSAFAQGREGPISTTAQRLTAKAGEQATAASDALDRQIRSFEIAQAQSEKKIADFEKKGLRDLASAERERLLEIQTAKDNAQTKFLETESTARKELSAITEAQNKSLSGQLTDNYLASASLDDINTLFANAPDSSLSKSIFVARKAAITELQDAIKAKDEGRIANAQAMLGEFDTADTETTAAQQDFSFFQELQASNPEMAERFADLKGFGEKDTFTKQNEALDIQIKQTKSEQLKSDLLEQKSNLEQLGIVYGTGKENILNKLSTYVADEIPITRDPSSERNGWCGAFVNDVLEAPNLFGDSLQSKMKNKNKDISQLPAAGDVFISKFGNDEVGHVGFIESVRIDEKGVTQVMLADSNRLGNRKLSKREVSLETLLKPELKGGEEVIGYYSPVNAARSGVNTGKLDKEVQSRLDRANAGESTQTVKSNKEAIKNALSSGDESTIKLAIDEIERKKFLPRTEKIQNDFEKEVKDYEDINNKFIQMNKALEAGREIDDFTFTDQALINLFNKISDPTSVVRESEFARTGSSLGLSERVTGAAIKQIKGGAGLTPASRDASIKIAGALLSGAKEQFIRGREKAEKKSAVSGVPQDFLYGQLGLNSSGEFGDEEDLVQELRVVTDPAELSSISDMIDKLESEGVPEEEIIDTLVVNGYDPDIFYKTKEN